MNFLFERQGWLGYRFLESRKGLRRRKFLCPAPTKSQVNVNVHAGKRCGENPETWNFRLLKFWRAFGRPATHRNRPRHGRGVDRRRRGVVCKPRRRLPSSSGCRRDPTYCRRRRLDNLCGNSRRFHGPRGHQNHRRAWEEPVVMVHSRLDKRPRRWDEFWRSSVRTGGHCRYPTCAATPRGSLCERLCDPTTSSVANFFRLFRRTCIGQQVQQAIRYSVDVHEPPRTDDRSRSDSRRARPWAYDWATGRPSAAGRCLGATALRWRPHLDNTLGPPRPPQCRSGPDPCLIRCGWAATLCLRPSSSD